jgi:uncharacterized membrane protein YhaH (DUF805 family)
MGLSGSISSVFKNAFKFSGRSRRPEYWWFVLFFIFGSIVLGLVDGVMFGARTPGAGGSGLLVRLFQLVTFVPFLAVGWRRLQDTGRPGWYLILPVLLSVVVAALVGTGIGALATLQTSWVNPSMMHGRAAALSTTLILSLAVIQFVCGILICWWMTRPSQKGANAYGPEPRVI